MAFDCNAVFEGGGVRGIGHVGAAAYLESAGYRFARLAGSSAGAIVAALLAAGYTGAELREVMRSVDYMRFKQKDFIDRLGIPGRMVSVWFNFGVYSADWFESWMHGLLEAKGADSFGAMNGRLRITATDVTAERLLVLPDHLPLFGLDVSQYPVSRAVRMSMSIPLFYEPFKLADRAGRVHYIVDGGVLSNYPVWLLDNGGVPQIPTFGFQFMPDGCTLYHCPAPPSKISLPMYLQQLTATAMGGYDRQFLDHSPGDAQRTIFIPTTVKTSGGASGISATDFGITAEQCDGLFENGFAAAEKFIRTWSFADWKRRFRPAPPTA